MKANTPKGSGKGTDPIYDFVRNKDSPRKRIFYILVCSLLILCIAAAVLSIILHGKEKFILGADTGYEYFMTNNGFKWSRAGAESAVLKILKKSGINTVRIGVCVQDDDIGGRNYASQVALRAKENSLDACFVFFLSDEETSINNQKSPLIWDSLPVAEKADAVKEYSEATVRYFKTLGIKTHLFEIGNEIDFGICGVFAGHEAPQNDTQWLSENIWVSEAKILKACQEGILKADAKAEFVIHLASWTMTERCAAFIKTILENGVRVDYTGLTYFPSSSGVSDGVLATFEERANNLSVSSGKPVIISETAYPCKDSFPGIYHEWKSALLNYPLTENGQRNFLSDLLNFCYRHKNIKGVFYKNPEWYNGEWWAFALFSEDGSARESVDAFSIFKDPELAAIDYAEKALNETESNRISKQLLQEAKNELREGNIEKAKFLARSAEAEAEARK